MQVFRGPNFWRQSVLTQSKISEDPRITRFNWYLKPACDNDVLSCNIVIFVFIFTGYRKEERAYEVLEEIEKGIQTLAKFIHVIRNPFDNIATLLLRKLTARDLVQDQTRNA